MLKRILFVFIFSIQCDALCSSIIEQNDAPPSKQDKRYTLSDVHFFLKDPELGVNPSILKKSLIDLDDLYRASTPTVPCVYDDTTLHDTVVKIAYKKGWFTHQAFETNKEERTYLHIFFLENLPSCLKKNSFFKEVPLKELIFLGLTGADVPVRDRFLQMTLDMTLSLDPAKDLRNYVRAVGLLVVDVLQKPPFLSYKM